MKEYEVHVRVVGYYIVKVNAEDMYEAAEKAELDYEENCRLGDLEYADGVVYSVAADGKRVYLQ